MYTNEWLGQSNRRDRIKMLVFTTKTPLNWFNCTKSQKKKTIMENLNNKLVALLQIINDSASKRNHMPQFSCVFTMALIHSITRASMHVSVCVRWTKFNFHAMLQSTNQIDYTWLCECAVMCTVCFFVCLLLIWLLCMCNRKLTVTMCIHLRVAVFFLSLFEFYAVEINGQ